MIEEAGSAGGARRAILESTRVLIERMGSAEVGLGAIADHAGYSRQTVYRHFGTRAGVLQAALADIDERAGAQAAVERILEAADGAGAVDALVGWWTDYVAGFIGIARSVLAGRRSDPELAAAWDDRMNQLLDVCRKVVHRCEADGLLSDGLDSAVAAEMLWAVLSVPLWDQLITDRGWTLAQYRQRITFMANAILVDRRT
ncbi:TetR/AcrR family transcriptional regulator [Mycobacterium sp. AMU20-3851]|uniref:TetR/AcrR family transcriptional regulator n=1 Tax=Mycobacterium sp. AMU20-3851 TaxID=3122055 RepID=UPI00375483C1